ncbi:LuxR family transcriptional regulator [Chania multitudinisentens RB-25]|uniref:LuxR family transcriptional regulator n=1 Tax=Chania multitudinisentens RB-25 TaxID=1441930 RepID=W0LJP3_9GAMM|nr:LuxR family transcriptional regulator [Chania multitudinisentens]AHG22220.1 LuxR family transcriptional regulator [Chania multitudinisentens RB-25]
MKLLIVDACCFTRLGIASHFTDNIFTSVRCSQSIDAALLLLANFQPSHILVNLTNYCRHSENNLLLEAFINATQSSTLHIYLETPYPYSEKPIRITDNAFLFSKTILACVLRSLRKNTTALVDNNHKYSLFSPQELAVMKYWLAETANYHIAKKLQISTHTVYVHKRHIMEKTYTRNRLEFYTLYNVLRYFYPTTLNHSPLNLVAV